MVLKRWTLHERIKDALIRDIVKGTLAPGERLFEMKIARELGTSQAPVREALRELKALGFVQGAPHQGTYVASFWEKGFAEVYKVRGGLEELATRMATPKLSGKTAGLQAEVDFMRAAASANDIEKLVEHSCRFHRLIMEASGNQLLLNMWDALHIETHSAVALMASEFDLMEKANSHQPIVDSIASGDVERACRVAREHQTYFEELQRERVMAAKPALSA